VTATSRNMSISSDLYLFRVPLLPKGKLTGLLALRLAVTSLKLWPASLKNFKSASTIARGIVPR